MNLETYLQTCLPTACFPVTLLPLHAHASYRSYTRVHCANEQTYIVMSIPPGKWSVSEEITHGTAPEELPFLNIARYLTNKNFPVPAVLNVDQRAGFILLQDLGDRLLEHEFRQKSLEEKIKLYQAAITLLVRLQNEAVPSPDCIAFQRQFDQKLLGWELDHFFEYGIEKRLDVRIDKADAAYFQEINARICNEVLSIPQCWVHRDYQSRNLIWHQDKLWLLDFQDALQGPITYDLVALLRDSYIALDRRLRESLIDDFLRLQKELYDKDIQRQEFSRMFDWTTIQRKLKDAGRFVFIKLERNNPNFMPYISDSLGYVREALVRQPDLQEFYERLKPYVPEWNKPSS